MTDQLQQWQSEFGNDYTDRNQVDWSIRLNAWKTMLAGLSLNHVVEVGPNRGHNLRCLHEIGAVSGNLVGVEPNQTAIQYARAHYPQAAFLEGNAFSLPFVDGYADLVFTAGVLIHISRDDLPRALAEMHRVSSKYVLSIEYFAEEETTIPYRGHDNLLWKRDFKAHYLNQFPDLTVINEGYWESDNGFDRATWWLFAK